MTNLEVLAKKIFDECEREGEPVTMNEALEMATFEIKSKDVDTNAQSGKKVERKRVRKVDFEKKKILEKIAQTLNDMGAENITTLTETEIVFDLENSNYSLRLVKHRYGTIVKGA